MPKNKGKGGKNRRRGKNEKDELKRELIEKDGDQQVYAQVQKMLGNARLTAFCFDGKIRMCLIRGKLRKKMWIGTGDIVLIGLRDYQDDKGDVILKYTPEEARVLKAQGHLPDSARLNELGDEQNEADVEFVDAADDGFDENDVAAQNREYLLFSSNSEESDSNEEVEEEEGDFETDEQIKSSGRLSYSTDDESEEDEENAELLAQRNERMKPGARDRRGKGKRGK